MRVWLGWITGYKEKDMGVGDDISLCIYLCHFVFLESRNAMIMASRS